jgi:hypothetical protein
MRTMRITSIALLIMAIASFTVISFVYSDDNNNRYRDDSSSVFAPGYLNAAKYQAEAVINQQPQKKSILENIAGLLESKTENKVQSVNTESMNNKPELKKKQSGGGKTIQAHDSNINAILSLLSAGETSMNGISAYIQNRVSDYVAQHLRGTVSGVGNTASDYKIAYANGKYYAAWNNPDNSVTTQIFDSDGNATLAAPSATIPVADSYGTLENLTVLSDGNIAIVWSDSAASSITAQVMDTSGKAMWSTPTTIRVANYGFQSISNVTALNNGGVAVFWNQMDQAGGISYSIRAQFIDSSGKTLSSPSAISTKSTGGIMGTTNVKVNANGNVEVSWLECPNNFYQTLYKTQAFDQQGKAVAGTSSSITIAGHIDETVALPDGKIAFVWDDQARNLQIQSFDPVKNLLNSPTFLTNNTYLGTIMQAKTLSDGSVAVIWREYLSGGGDVIKAQIVDPSLHSKLTAPIIITNPDIIYSVAYAQNITELADGKILVLWNGNTSSNGPEFYAQIYDNKGNAYYAAPALLASSGGIAPNNVTVFNDGTVAIFWRDGTTPKVRVLDSYGAYQSTDVLKPPTPIASLQNAGKATLNNPYISSPFSLNIPNSDTSTIYNLSQAGVSGINNGTPGNILKSLLIGKDLAQDMSARGYSELANTTMAGPIKESVIVISVRVDAQDLEIASRLSNILKNPTEDQKVILDAIKSLLADSAKINEDGKNANPELLKAQNDLLNAVANILLAQAVPDLLKKGDISNIKTMFRELDNTKNKIMLEYAKSTKPYYDNMLKDMAKNMAVLQGRNLLNPNMTKDELDKLPPSELDKILEKIKNMKDKTFEEEYLLQQEAKYRKEYLDPNKKKLEEDMKDMMKNFTGRISDVLKSTEKK